MTKILQNNVHQNHMTEITLDWDIICLYQNACDPKKMLLKRIKKKYYVGVYMLKSSKNNSFDDLPETKLGKEVKRISLETEINITTTPSILLSHIFNSKYKLSISSNSSSENDQDLKLLEVEVNTFIKNTENKDDNKKSFNYNNSNDEGFFNNNEDDRGSVPGTIIL
ncbi:hypothetical protein C2G38_2174179 [Gigaspora rosea]|uniref:Uncharacterized protein n=1 Tax=Gigaspora rosea TaxID=44941 RepID=A0A397VIS7_9GLOM|nr:hypothetical protein C2G38_2174179 [Gigaspora rosea]